MELREIVKQTKIVQFEVGSSVYGASTPESDTDYMGIFIAPKRYYLGLDKVEEVDLSILSKLPNGKNAKDAIDSKYYELRKFMKLLMENNPNILSSLYTPKDKFVWQSFLGIKLFDHIDLFPHRGLKKKYLGYAFSQKHKMVIKTDNYNSLNNFNDFLDIYVMNPREEELRPGCYYSNQLLAELRSNRALEGIVGFHDHHALIGDINISLTDKLSKVHKKVKERVSKVGNREELYTKFSYDVKFGMHLVRLMFEGKELLETGKLEYPLKDRQTLLDIRNGKWTKEDIISYSEQLEAEIEDITVKSVLPASPQYDKIEKLLIELIEESWDNS